LILRRWGRINADPRDDRYWTAMMSVTTTDEIETQHTAAERTAAEAASVAAASASARAEAGTMRDRQSAHHHRHRTLGETVTHAPQALRAMVRADEIWLVVLSALVGTISGLLVAAMTICTQTIHTLLFNLPPGERLSGAVSLEPARALAVPVLGGLLLGLVTLGFARWRPKRAVDPIEANALYGGRMSMRDSWIVVVQTMMSNGFGASVGLEAAYTQIGGGMGSWFGRMFRVRRNDMRLMVGCGAAAAIAGAFDAPLAGAFYAYELVIGTYSIATLAPVVVAAIIGTGIVQGVGGSPGRLELLVPTRVDTVDYIPLVALGVLCALVAICIMRGCTLTEELFRRSRVPDWLRPAIGGMAIGGMALISPAMMSSGHTALSVVIDAPYPLRWVIVLIVLKATASAVSIGSGFRGGLFFASLFLGAMVGKVFSGVLLLASPTHAVPAVVCAIVGMSSMAVAIVGGPLTMTFLALEETGSLPMTAAVLAAAVVSALTVRRTFGYSFATWRFHLRGEAIRSAVDIGWMRNLTVGRMMRREIRTVRTDTSLAKFKRDFPLGSEQRVIVIDEKDRYAGMVLVPEAHAAEGDKDRVSEVLHHTGDYLLPQMTVKEATTLFEAAEADALTVVDAPETRKVLGVLTEQYTLRRYSEELDRRRKELSGE
jgi:chloride channel protein, CIC family